jgi:hypothetical protein
MIYTCLLITYSHPYVLLNAGSISLSMYLMLLWLKFIYLFIYLFIYFGDRCVLFFFILFMNLL